jgi:hypothetical protein
MLAQLLCLVLLSLLFEVASAVTTNPPPSVQFVDS